MTGLPAPAARVSSAQPPARAYWLALILIDIRALGPLQARSTPDRPGGASRPKPTASTGDPCGRLRRKRRHGGAPSAPSPPKRSPAERRWHAGPQLAGERKPSLAHTSRCPSSPGHPAHKVLVVQPDSCAGQGARQGRPEAAPGGGAEPRAPTQPSWPARSRAPPAGSWRPLSR